MASDFWADLDQPKAPPKGGFWADLDSPSATTAEMPAKTAPTMDFSQLAGGTEAKLQRTPGFLQSLKEEATAPFVGLAPRRHLQFAMPQAQEPAGMREDPEVAAERRRLIEGPGVGERLGLLGQFINAPFRALGTGTTRAAAEYLPIEPQYAERFGGAAELLAQSAFPLRSGGIPGQVLRGVEGTVARREAGQGVQALIAAQQAARAAKPTPTPASALSPEEIAARDEMTTMLGGKRKPKKSPLDILKDESGAISLPGLRRDPNAPVSHGRLIAGGLGEESSKTLTKTMGAEGGEMAKLAKAVRNETELEAHGAQVKVNDALKGLNEKQLDNLVDVLEGKARPIDAKVNDAFTVARQELDRVAARASEVGLEIKNPITGEKIPFQPRQNYFPHMFKEELGQVVKDPFRKAKIKADIKTQLEAGLSKSNDAARWFHEQGLVDVMPVDKKISDRVVEAVLQRMIKATRGREGHLEIARVFDVGDYNRNPQLVLTKHFNDAYRRINIAEKFGADLGKGEEMLTSIGAKKGEFAEEFARKYFQRSTHTEPINRLAHEAVNTAVNVNNFTKLGQAAIANASQPAYTAVVAGAKNAAKGYGAAMTKEGRDFARKILGDSASQFYEDVAAAGTKSLSGKAADKVLQYTGFNFVERLNRTVSANAGKYFARDTFDKLVKNPVNKKARETLTKMNVDVDAALKRGALNEADELRAGQSIVNRTQFKTDVTELPLFWTSESGRLLTQYKRFQFKSGQLVKDEILKEAAKGNVMPLVRAAAILPAAGAAVVTVKDAIRWGPQSDHERTLVDYLSAVGTFGAFADAFTGYGKQPVKGLSWLAGPTLGTVGGFMDATVALGQGEGKPMGKMLASQVPVVGPSLRGLFNKPESPQRKLERELGITDLMNERRKMQQESRKLRKEAMGE